MIHTSGVCRLLLKTTQKCQDAVNSGQFLQLVRWRKRRWTPPSAAKMFWVPERQAREPEETKELKKRTDNHNTYTKALFYHFQQELKSEKAEKTSAKAMRQEAAEMRELIEINRVWNAETGRRREAWIAQMDQQEEEKRLQALLDHEEREKLQLREAQARVQQAKELAKSFVTLENLDAEIEKALNNKVNYNFSIDLQGNRYVEMPDGSTRNLESDSNNSKERSTS